MLNAHQTQDLKALIKLLDLWRTLDIEAQTAFLEAKLEEARARYTGPMRVQGGAQPGPRPAVVARVQVPDGTSRTALALAEVDAGARVQDVAAKYGIAQTTIYKARLRRTKKPAEVPTP